MGKENYSVGIDIGSDKIVCLIGKKGETEELNVVGIGVRESKGIRSGGIKDLEIVSNDIREAVKEAETMALVDVEEAVVSISGSHLQSINSVGTINVTGKEKITEEEINKLMNQARNLPIPNDREILYMLPQEYTLDSQDGIINPIGMTGNKLDIKVHIVTALSTAVHNLTTAVNKAGVEIKAFIPSAIAASETVLNYDEKELGVGMIDFGEGTIDIAFYERGSLWSSVVIPLGGFYFTNDIAIGLKTTMGEAKKIKKKYGSVILTEQNRDQTIKIRTNKSGEEKQIPMDLLVEILYPRAEEMLKLIKDTLEKNGILRRMNAGIVLTGGTANLNGLDEVAETIFNLPARIGKPDTGIEGLLDRVRYPEFSVSVGLLLFSLRHLDDVQVSKKKSFWSKIKSLFESF